VPIPSGGTIQQDFILTAPTMIISPTFHTYTLNPEEYFTTSTGILNTGDGPLTWNAQVVYPVTDFTGHAPVGQTLNTPPDPSTVFTGAPFDDGIDATFDCAPEDIFTNPNTPTTGSWSYTVSDPGFPNLVYSSFSGLTDMIGSVAFWGIQLTATQGSCSEDPKEFLIEFYEAGAQPGALVASYTVSSLLDPTGQSVAGYPVSQWYCEFPSVDLADGWITIQSNSTCMLWWGNSVAGTGSALNWNGSSYSVTAGGPRSFCLGAGGAGSWLTLDYYDNIVPPMGGLDNVPTNFDAQGTLAGEVYTADLVFSSQDPDVGTITIPCTMIIAGDPMVPPTDLTVTLIDDIIGTVELNWLWATDLTFQFFIVKRDGVPVGTSVTTTYQEDLPDYGTYCYTVQTFYDEGTSVPSDEACVDWDLPVVFVDPDFHEAWVWTDTQYAWETTIYNLGIGTLAYTIPPVGGCDHEVVMYDDFGDGWNGGALTVYVDGDIALDGITMSGGGPVYEYFTAASGQTISSTFSCGSWCYENSYYIYDGFGALVFSDGLGGVDPTGGAGPAACPGFIIDVTPMAGFVPENGSEAVTVTWDATGFPAGDYYQDFFVESNDPVTPSVTVTNLMHVTIPGQFAGNVTDCETGLPLAGVTVTAAPFQTLTDASGNYSLYVDEDYYMVTFEKLSYFTKTVIDTFAAAGIVTPLDVCMYEFPNPVPWVLATVLYPAEDTCQVEWSLPEGPYEIIYDDGEAEDLFAWSTAGNENAVKFTPLGYPATVIGGRLFVGDGTFPAGSWLGTDFVLMVYDDDGAAGMPGTVLDSITVTVNNFGWVEFSGLDVTLDDGEFYLSMLQINPSPNTAPIGIDASLPNVYRSYSRTTITPDWSLSVYQDFMIRAYVEGSQTDVLTDSYTMVYPPKVNREKASEYFSTANNSPFVTRPGTVKAGSTGNIEGYVDNSETVLYYTVARMSDFDPNLGPATGIMTVLENVTTFTFDDDAFGALPMGWYAYAVQVAYSGSSLSTWTYSNIVGRDMDAAVT
ncbi:MAG: carboxypeptidase regulatory-like domain-containing protein, partial [Bacteroidales bacterium]|nr:carboxypeptidase regulatory-like domain-containing protein [Bacteroidales bacterium]